MRTPQGCSTLSEHLSSFGTDEIQRDEGEHERVLPYVSLHIQCSNPRHDSTPHGRSKPPVFHVPRPHSGRHAANQQHRSRFALTKALLVTNPWTGVPTPRREFHSEFPRVALLWPGDRASWSSCEDIDPYSESRGHDKNHSRASGPLRCRTRVPAFPPACASTRMSPHGKHAGGAGLPQKGSDGKNGLIRQARPSTRHPP